MLELTGKNMFRVFVGGSVNMKKKIKLFQSIALIMVMLMSFVLSGCSSADYKGINTAVQEYYKGANIKGTTVTMVVNVADDRNTFTSIQKIGGYEVTNLAYLGTSIGNAANVAVLLTNSADISEDDVIDIYIVDVISENAYTIDIIAVAL